MGVALITSMSSVEHLFPQFSNSMQVHMTSCLAPVAMDNFRPPAMEPQHLVTLLGLLLVFSPVVISRFLSVILREEQQDVS